MAFVNLLAAGVLGLGAVAVFYAQGIYALVTKKTFAWLPSFERAILFGVMCIGIGSFIQGPNPTSSPTLIFSFTPHAYNLIIWPVAGFFILGRRFKPMFLIPALAMVYGLDELVWNGLVLLRFGWITGVFSYGVPDLNGGPPVGQGILWWMVTPYWLGFFALMAFFLAGGVYLLRPRFINLRISVPIVLVFGLFWAFAANFTLAGGPVIWSPTGLALEVMWQVCWWYFVFVSVRP